MCEWLVVYVWVICSPMGARTQVREVLHLCAMTPSDSFACILLLVYVWAICSKNKWVLAPGFGRSFLHLFVAVRCSVRGSVLQCVAVCVAVCCSASSLCSSVLQCVECVSQCSYAMTPSDSFACMSLVVYVYFMCVWYGVALVDRLHKTIGLFCKRAL